MRIKSLTDEDFIQYKKSSMFISTCYCDWKCPKEQGLDVEICQNQPLCKQENIDIPIELIFDRYIKNPISQAICIGGLEPFLQFEEIFSLIRYFREKKCADDFVIYTGYYLHEIEKQVSKLKQFENITIKFGRYIPAQDPHYDDILGIYLASSNQYSKKIS